MPGAEGRLGGFAPTARTACCLDGTYFPGSHLSDKGRSSGSRLSDSAASARLDARKSTALAGRDGGLSD